MPYNTETQTKPMMNPQVKEKWINALRSGEYSQGTGKLRSTQGFCCLGVLCDLYAKENNQEWDYRGYTDESTPSKMDYWYFDEESEFLPQIVQEWAGLPEINPQVKVLDEYCYDENDEDVYTKIDVAELNDNGVSFVQLSELIADSL